MKCDELKWKWAFFPYLDAPEKQHESAVNDGYVKVVLKDEAEKQLSVMRIEIRHQKYKRCLAMASLSLEKIETYRAEYEEWCLKWYKRWLELAEKFKLKNGVNNG